MESPGKMTKGNVGNTLRRFMRRKFILRPDKHIRVRIVSKPQPDGSEHMSAEDSPQLAAEGSDDANRGEGNRAECGIYISRRSRGVDFSSGVDSVEEVIDVHSDALSKESDLFRRLFEEMEKESQGEPPTIQIEASEENAFIRLLEFIDSSIVPSSSYEEIVDLLLASDEFQVRTCASECIDELVWKPNPELSCFKLCDKVHCASTRELLAKKAMNFVNNTMKENEDRNRLSIENELLQLPFSAIKAVFCIDSLEVESEDVLYDFMLYWARIHHPKPEDRYSAKELHLECLIRFTYLTHQKLEEALQCDFFYPESISKAVAEALLFQVGGTYHGGLASSNLFLERHYKRLPIVVTRLRFPEFDRCEVYFSLTEDELVKMYNLQLKRRETRDFQFGHQLFHLVASWNEDSGETCFGLSITAKARPLDDVVYTIRFLAKREVHDRAEFSEVGSDTLIPSSKSSAGSNDLIPGFWPEFFSCTCCYMIAGTLRLCVEITCKR
ncbi:BTB/POZ domain-containing protein At2g46260-like [Elaeis guineensis]|uniref:BTB/POZ domain-containing protein At2g46260-like n=1 Tax=Elaeis guineensis var. tenera TaxID=51953 RepID=A0A6I9QGU3_ELAGV|nr:BTB/POZ domain-containing protein At2g46260-like [Elaeis guineensis]